MTPITIKTAMKKNYPTGDQVIVRAEEGRYTCKDDALFDVLVASEGKTIEVELNGSLIIAVNAPADEPAEDEVPETPFPEEEEEAPAPAPAAKPAAKKAEPKKAAPKVEAPAENDEEDDDSDDEPETPNIAQKTEGLTEEDQFEPNTLFPLLRAEEIEVRVGQIYDNYLTLLLYKNARCDQDRLDAKYGPLGWQTSYQILDGQLFCTVSVRNPDTGEWISKTDVGTPSNTEAEKGRVSDAFKRSCVCWGSGRELYSAPEIKVYADKTQIKKNQKGKLACYDKFAVKSIAYDKQRRISKLEIYGAHARGIVFRFGK
ncbi:MAG: hypothetical protein IJZ68_06720 [Bacteroidaceae bacterium]|nr:hypothetical protein [Bacteroidaceae bacterium]